MHSECRGLGLPSAERAFARARAAKRFVARIVKPCEKGLKDMIVVAPQSLSAPRILIGRQEKADHGGSIDTLATVPVVTLILRVREIHQHIRWAARRCPTRRHL